MCKDVKTLEMFSKNRKKKDGLNTHCKICHTSYWKKNYQENKEHILDQRKEYQKEWYKFFNDLKDNKECVDCKNKFPYFVLQWDHLENKEFAISEGVRMTKMKSLILKEIEKCELVCANCHAFRTYNRKHKNAV